MQKLLSLACVASFSLVVSTSAQTLLDVNYDGQTVGVQPTGAVGIRPTVNSGTNSVTVVTGAGNPAGGGVGEGIEILDQGGTGSGIDYTFVSGTATQVGAIKVEIDVANLFAGTPTADSMFFSVGNYSSSTTILYGSNANRAFSFRLYSDGDLQLGNGTQQTTVLGASNSITLYMNDSSVSSLNYLDPLGNAAVLGTDSVAFYLGNSLIDTVALNATNTGWINSDASFGRLGFATNTTGTGLDWNVDNIVVTLIPEPSSSALIGLGVAGGLLFRRRIAQL